VVTIIVDGNPLEAPEGATLLEVLRHAGIYIPSLCYMERLPPYAGCRMCLVEIEGARGLQLSCTSKVADGMEVRTNTAELIETRKAVLSIILANHPDRCLTCHRVVKCKPGDTCLRDNVVTHRCLTCSRNYRCELQTTCELVGMAGFEPWVGEARSYYQTPPPAADRGNPFLEFDPQMCIICTRCVRACDEIRHTTAITLAGRGWDARIEFGAGGPIHESNCDFCGSCIDVCPTATLMEKPNKWAATETEAWVPTACAYCSVGCTISLGVKKGRGVIVRADPSNPVSHDQLCVRGRFHYDSVKYDERLEKPLVRRDGELTPATWDAALDFAATHLAGLAKAHGPEAIGFLGSPFATNEENYLLGKLARAVLGSNNVDTTIGPMMSAVGSALRGAFGTEVLPADMTGLARSKTILVVADDLESSHNVACLRVKDAVVNNGARLIVLTPRWGELCDFAAVWLRPQPGEEAATLVALASALAEATGAEDAAQTPAPQIGPQLTQTFQDALAILNEAVGAPVEERGIAVVCAAPHLGEQATGATIAALSNIALLCCGPDQAAHSLFVLPPEANGWGLRDVGAAPDLLPGYRSPADDAARREVEVAWGALSSSPGLDFDEMLAAARDGSLKAMVVMGDNPLFFAPDKAWVRECLSSLDFLLVIDSLLSDTARLAHVVLPDVSMFGKNGTYTNADRRIVRARTAVAGWGEARPAWRILADLGARLDKDAERWAYLSPDLIMEEMAMLIPLYGNARYGDLESGAQQAFEGYRPSSAAFRPVASEAAVAPGDGLVLTTGRSLYTSLDGATIHSPEADKLHRDEYVEMNPLDAARLGLQDGQEVALVDGRAEVAIRVRITEAVQPGVIFVPLYYDGGAVTALFARDGLLPRVKAAVRTPA
jgi:predicted molibdopterin-dependent oxidoreductase YjgC